MAVFVKILFSLLVFSIFLDAASARSTEFREKALVKRGLVEDVLTAGSGPVCGYILAFTYSMAKYKLQKLTEYLAANLPSLMTKRDVEVAYKRDFDLYGALVSTYRSLSCKLIVQYLKANAGAAFQQLLQYVTDNITSIVGK